MAYINCDKERTLGQSLQQCKGKYSTSTTGFAEIAEILLTTGIAADEPFVTGLLGNHAFCSNLMVL